MSRSSGRPPLLRSPLRAVARLGLASCLAVPMFTAVLVLPVAAETPTEVADETLTDGVYIGFGRSREDEGALETAVERASFAGVNLVVVKPSDPQPTARAFARRVQEQTDADAALVFPAEGIMEAYVADDYGDSGLRAVNAGRDAADPVAAVEAFTEALTTEPEVATPPIVRQVALVLVAATLTIAVVAALEARFFRQRRAVRA